MRNVLVLAVILMTPLLVGCGNSGITLYRVVDGEPQPAVEIEQRFAGKGCIAVDSQGDAASVIVQQAGTSDWSVSRAFGFLGDIVGGVFGGDRGMDEMQGPAAAMQGCEGLFNGETALEPDPEIPNVPLTYHVIPVP